MKTLKPHGPFNLAETRRFMASAIAAHEDSVNHRFDLDVAASDLEGRAFDEEEMWETLEIYRLSKWTAATYNASLMEV